MIVFALCFVVFPLSVAWFGLYSAAGNLSFDDGLLELAQFHQHIAKQAKIRRQSSTGCQFAGKRLGFVKAMEIMQHVAAQKHCFETAGAAGIKTKRAGLGEFVVTGVETFARLGDKHPAEPFQFPAGIVGPARFFLKADYLPVHAPVTSMSREYERTGAGKT